MATSTVVKYGQALKTYRSISHQLRRNKVSLFWKNLEPIRDSNFCCCWTFHQDKVSSMPMIEHIRSVIRQHEATDQRLCRAPEELQFLGNTYRTYLESGERYRDLYGKYFGKGEKTIEEAARTVGLKLPEMPNIKPWNSNIYKNHYFMFVKYMYICCWLK